MEKITANSNVTIAYEGKLENGDTFKTVTEKKPLNIKIGASDIPPTLEQGIIGMSAGEKKSIKVPPEEGYGPRQKILVHSVALKQFGDKIVPKPGMVLSLKVEKDGEDHEVPATVMEIKNESVIVDYNHPLAGHHLTYHITILNVDNS